MIIKPILNQSNDKLIKSLIKNMPQSLLLTGEVGVGLCTIAKYIANLCKSQNIIILPEKDENINIKSGVIGVEIIRRIYNDTRTKTANNRIIIIDYAERMTTQAQNAFLKLLEEPGDGIHFILLSHSSTKLLPTILSRVEQITIKKITKHQSEILLDNLGVKDIQKRNQILFIANGLPAEIYRLINDDEYFKLRSQSVCDARTLIIGEQYLKILIIQKYKDDRDLVLQLLIDMTKLLINNIYSKKQINVINKLESVINTYEVIDKNGNIKLALAKMII